jgi:hypothetical protein
MDEKLFNSIYICIGAIWADEKTSPVTEISINNVTEVKNLTFGLYKLSCIIIARDSSSIHDNLCKRDKFPCKSLKFPRNS